MYIQQQQKQQQQKPHNINSYETNTDFSNDIWLLTGVS